MGLSFATNRFLSEFSTFGIGGPIRYFSEVKKFEEMREGFLFAAKNKLPVLVLGKGSNSLFDDRGFPGVVLLNKIDFCEWSHSSVYVGAGHSFSFLGVQSARKELSGLEFASGIPASVGGAIFMNAGANGKETCEHLRSVTFLHSNGDLQELRKEDLIFGYRSSSFQSMQGAILAATFDLIPEAQSSREKQLQIISHRMKTQPLKDKSIGCIFQNPSASVGAGFLIDRCGLKGFRVGEAKVSEIHANFIVNEQGATAKQVLDLIALIQEKVFLQTGVHLEPEIRFISYDT